MRLSHLRRAMYLIAGFFCIMGKHSVDHTQHADAFAAFFFIIAHHGRAERQDRGPKQQKG